MTRSRLFALASLLAATTLAAPGSQAQQPPAAGGPPQQGAGAPPPGDQSGPPPGAEGQAAGPPWPVTMVISVEVLRSQRAGGLDIVRARGLASSNAWGDPHLIPITRGTPADGILDLIFMATAPSSSPPLGPFMEIEAILPIEAGHPYKGVRVRSGSNVVALKTLPGYAEVTPPKDDCAKCLGKVFVAKGANPPAGAAANTIVREADLPWTLRVIKPTDGIPNYGFDPNRLTLVLSEDGRIVDAAWD